ncbi:MAG: arsenic metallochaperone ArsD family protein [Betaproteobacteria bacterium]|nr:arsenic metallochaperone ArsD family protein [Betaproteobacteria bacterium]
MPKISSIRIIELSAAKGLTPDTLDADLEWVKKRGVTVERLYQDSSSPEPDSGDFAGNAIAALHSLPLVLIDGNIALSGRYPTREEMGIWMLFGLVRADDRNRGSVRCCTL